MHTRFHGRGVRAAVFLTALMTATGTVWALTESAQIDEQVFRWLERPTTGLRVSLLETASRFLANLETDDIDLDKTKAKLTWNLKCRRPRTCSSLGRSSGRQIHSSSSDSKPRSWQVTS